MLYVSFFHGSSLKIENELRKPIFSVEVEKFPHGEISSLKLMRRDSTFIRITNIMYQAGERAEVGRLAFDLSEYCFYKSSTISLPDSFGSYLSVFKIIMKDIDIGVEVESGIIIRAHDGRELSIVAADFPHALCVEGAGFHGHSVREYPEENYIYLSL